MWNRSSFCLKVQKIISGGQTGVDRAALDVALALGLDVGGWCPKGRRAEDGRIPDRYSKTVFMQFEILLIKIQKDSYDLEEFFSIFS